MHKLVVRPLSRHLQPFKKCLPSLAFFCKYSYSNQTFYETKKKDTEGKSSFRGISGSKSFRNAGTKSERLINGVQVK